MHAVTQGLGHFPIWITEMAPYILAGLLLCLNVTRRALAFLVSGALLFFLWALIAVVGLIGALLVAVAGGPLGWGLLTAAAIMGLGWCLQERD
jgi:polyferredoxin